MPTTTIHASQLPTSEARWEALAKTAAAQTRDLILANVAPIERVMLDEGTKTMRLSIAVEFTEEPGGFDLRTTIGYSRRYKDERETFVDPYQTDLFNPESSDSHEA